MKPEYEANTTQDGLWVTPEYVRRATKAIELAAESQRWAGYQFWCGTAFGFGVGFVAGVFLLASLLGVYA